MDGTPMTNAITKYIKPSLKMSSTNFERPFGGYRSLNAVRNRTMKSKTIE